MRGGCRFLGGCLRASSVVSMLVILVLLLLPLLTSLLVAPVAAAESSFVVQSIRPTIALRGRNTSVSIKGVNFHPSDNGWACWFGPKRVDAQRISAEELQCPSLDVGSGHARVPIRISSPDDNDDEALLATEFTFTTVEPIAAFSAYPSSGPTSGGTPVIVQVVGQSLSRNFSYSCSFGDSSSRVLGSILNSTHLQCSSPTRSEPGRAELRVLYSSGSGDGDDDDGLVDNGTSLGSRATGFIFYEQPILDEVLPPACTELSTTTIALRGSGFRSSHRLMCRFGDVVVPGRILSSLQIQCDAPPLRPGPVPVEVSANGGVDFTSSGVVLNVYTRFTILSKSPEEGPMRGGMNITVHGTGFRTIMGMSCYFGNSRSRVDAVYKSANELSCPTPPSPLLGSVPFEVCWGQRVDCVACGNYTYRDELRLLEAAPRSGSDSGGTVVTIVMNRALPLGSQCRFGSVYVPLEDVNGTVGYCRSPAQPFSDPNKKHSFVDLTAFGGGYDSAVGSFQFTYLPPISLDEVIPRNIPEVDSGIVRVLGQNLPNAEGLACLIGGTSAGIASVPATWISKTLIWCNMTMTSLVPGGYALTVAYGDQSLSSRSSNTLDIDVDPAVSITRIVPANGPPGTSVAIYGTNLASSTRVSCRFGSKIVSAHTIVNASCIKCIAPIDRRYLNREPVPLSVSTNGIHFPKNLHAFFTFTDDARIASLDPDIVEVSRGNVTISINGTDLDAFLESDPHCHLKGTSISTKATIVSATEAACEMNTIPKVGTYTLELFSMHQSDSRTSNLLRVVPSPVVTAAQPSWVLTSATGSDTNTSILVRGTNFTSWKLSCIIGRDVSPAIRLSSSTALCNIPFLRRGNHTFRVSNDGSTPSLSSVDFFVFEPIQLHSLVPSRGGPGSLVTVRGRDFMPGMACKFGNERSSVPSRFINSTHIQCTAPPRPIYSAGLAEVDVFLDEVSVSAGGPRIYFEYIEFFIASLNPSSGSIQGGTTVAVKLRSNNSDVVSHCRFGSVVVEALATSQKDEVECVSPPAPTTEGGSTVSFALSGNGVDYSTSYLHFTYLLDPDIDGMEPLSGPEVGGTELLLFGHNFANRMDLGCRFVMFGGSINELIDVEGQWYSGDSITCLTPRLFPGEYSVQVTLNGIDYVDTGFLFEAEPMVTIGHADPTFARTSGGTVVTISGTNFAADSDSVCMFDDDRVAATFKSPNKVECTAPRRNAPSPSTLSVSHNGDDFASLTDPFIFYNDLVVDSFLPLFGTVRGGTKIRIWGSDFDKLLEPVYCVFGKELVKANVESESLLACESPKVPAPVNQILAIQYGKDLYSIPGVWFSYENDIRIDSLSPSSLPSNVGRAISVNGGTFRESSSLCCRLGSNTSPAIYVDEGHIYCPFQMGMKPGFYRLAVANNCQDFSPNPASIQVLSPMQPLALAPTKSLCAGGATLTISGTNFIDTGRLSCRFGEQFVAPARYVNSTHIQCVAPPRRGPGPTSVDIMIDNILVPADPPLNLEYLDLSVVSFKPSSGSVQGGTTVTIKLRQDNDAAVVSHCRFGGTIVEALASGNKGEVQCTSPPISHNHTVPSPKVILDLSINGVKFTTSHLYFTYLANPVVDNIEPSLGPEVGGTTVSLNGQSFANTIDLGCMFTNVGSSGDNITRSSPILVEGIWLSSESMSCPTPRLAPAQYAIAITTNGIDYVDSGHFFTSYPQITIATVEPSSGPVAGGTEIIVYGGPYKSNFALECKFGNASLVPAVYHDASRISCTSPVGMSHLAAASSTLGGTAPASLQVTANGVDFTNILPFHYHPAPFFSKLVPRQGIANETTTVIIHGSNFPTSLSNSAQCMFGSHTVNAVVLSGSKVRCDSPPQPRGEVQVFISFNDGHDWSHPCQDVFEYKQVGSITSISPAGGPSSGGMMVRIMGSDFSMSPTLCCKYGDVTSNQTIWMSADEVHCEAPPHRPGVVALQVLNDCSDEESVRISAAFEFYHRPIVSSFTPSSGPESGGTRLRIIGRHLRATEGMYCKYGEKIRVGAVASPDGGYVECLSTPKTRLEAQDDMVNVTVGDYSGMYHAESELWFSYIKSPSIKELSPPFGSLEGYDHITITGLNLNSTGSIWCRFSAVTDNESERRSVTIAGMPLTNTSAICKSPAQSKLLPHSDAAVHVDVSTNEEADWSSERLVFRYLDLPVVSRIHPQRMQRGGTRVVISGSNFEQARKYNVGFGPDTVPVRAEWQSNQTLLCNSPRRLPNNPGKVEVFLIVDGAVNISTTLSFEYLRPISIFDSHPTRGPLHGGTLITVRGTNFVPTTSLSCRFGTTSIVPAHFVTKNEVRCITAPMGKMGKTSVEVSLDGQDFYQSANSSAAVFTYEPMPSIKRTIPANAPIGRATNVTLIGNHFVDVSLLACRFGTERIPAVYHSSHQVTCLVPASSIAGQVSVSITTNGVDYSIDRVAFRYLNDATVDEVSPSIVQEGVETALVVKGTNFVDSRDLYCHFGNGFDSEAIQAIRLEEKHGNFSYLTIAQWLSPNTLRCRTPPLALKWSSSGVVALSVTNNGGRSLSAQTVPIQLTTKAAIMSFSPTFGYERGGAEVTVRSNHLHHQPESTVCLWGETTRIPATMGASRHEILCTSPAHPAGDVALSIASHGIAPLHFGTFSFVPEPIMEGLRPSHGSVEGGTPIVITGKHLTNITSCIFDIVSRRNISTNNRRVIAPAKVLSSTEITCTSPEMSRQTNALVRVTTTAGGGYTSQERLYFVYRNPPRLLSAEPLIGPDIGGTAVTLEGHGFEDTPDLKCRFGLHADTEVQARFISPRRILCTAPMLPTGDASIYVTTNGVDYTSQSAPFRLHGPIEIYSIAPSMGTVRGGTRVIVQATNLEFTEDLACNFGEIHVDATYIGLNSLSCISPEVAPIATGQVSISITLNGRDYASGPNNMTIFSYVPAPEVLRIVPDQGWKNGGTEIRLETRNAYFDASAQLYCSFGGPHNLVEAQYHADNLVTCKSPKYDGDNANGVKNAVAVSLVYEGTNPRTWGGPKFIYVNGAVVSSISPAVGSVLGGTSVVVSGINFENHFDLQCLFGDQAEVPARFINDRLVSCESPSQRVAPGTVVDVSVESASGSLKTVQSFAQFEYISHPSIYSAYPVVGSSRGGTTVIINGHGFSESHAHLLSCRFGNSPPILIKYESPQKIWCLSPSLANTTSDNTTVDVAVSINGQDWEHSRDDDNKVIFSYVPPLRIMDIQPKWGPVTGGTRVEVSFASGVDIDMGVMKDIKCHFGDDLMAPATVLSQRVAAAVECIAPPLEEPQSSSVYLEISVHGGNDMTTSQQTYSYYRDPIVERIEPSYGYATGGEKIRVYGYHFAKSTELACRFDTHASPQVRWISSNEIECTSPRIDPPIDNRLVTVEVATNGVNYGKTNEHVAWPDFVYVDNPAVVNVTPSIASADGGTLCVIKGKHLERAIACRFGTFGVAVPVINKTSSQILCKPPPILPNSPYLLQEAEVFVEYSEIGFHSVGLEITYEPHMSKDELYTISLNDTNAYPLITSVVPDLVGAMGGYRLTVLGDNFVNRQGLACSFGPKEIIIPARFISSQEIQCPSPRLTPGVVMLDVINGGSRLKSKKGHATSFFADFAITRIEPTFGPVNGGTIVSIYGPYPAICLSEGEVQCRFGSVDVYAYRADGVEIGCIAPPAFYPEAVKVQVSCNDGKSFSESFGIFSYESNVQATALLPSHGGLLGGTNVLVTGSHFKNTTSLKCLFGNLEAVSAKFLSQGQILCKSPPRKGPGLVNVEVTTNGADYSSSLQKFEYRRPPIVESIWPNAGDAVLGGTKVYIKGLHFSDEVHVACSFDGILVQATYIDNQTIFCLSTPHRPGVFPIKVVGDMYSEDLSYQSEPMEFLLYESPSVVSISPRKGSARGGIPVFITGSNFINTTALKCRFGPSTEGVRATFISNRSIMCVTPPSSDNSRMIAVPVTVSVNSADYSRENDVRFEYHIESQKGYYGPLNTPAPNGTIAQAGDVNFTRCEPGTYQPKAGQAHCLPAPVGYYTPDFGLSKPVICPAGMVCDETGLAAPSSPCPRGHHCPSGTKAKAYSSLWAEDLSLLQSVYLLWQGSAGNER